ncbi:MAG: hypothetical protein K2W95_00815 [Candidatus Obscuribacterales bacterium]|nr:hypothetical protein [Candidatus Obscuribacterales bacterium]
MANNTWRGATNEVLRLARLRTIASDAEFNLDSGLESEQSAAKYYVRLLHYHLSLKAVKHFASRRLQLPVSDGTGVYALDTGINPSAIAFRSFINVTAGGTQNRELESWDYEKFSKAYPDASVIQEGAPTHWILLPLERTDESPVWKVRIFPTPDATYDIQYQAKLNAYPLTEAASVVLWPPEYEFALWEHAWSLLESGLGEGKEALIAQMAKDAIDRVMLADGVPVDNRRGVRTMSPIRKHSRWPIGRYTGWVSSPLG